MPQVIFCASVSIRETQTPSMDILKQSEEKSFYPNQIGRANVTRPKTSIKKKNINSSSSNRVAKKVTIHTHNSDLIKTPKRSILRDVRPRKQQIRRSPGPVSAPIKRYDSQVLNTSGNFATHTISSAIKADYDQPEIKYKLDELNSSVKKKRIEKRIPKPRKRPLVDHSKPFVVRKVGK